MSDLPAVFYLSHKFIGLRFEYKDKIDNGTLDWIEIPGILCGYKEIRSYVYLLFYDSDTGEFSMVGGDNYSLKGFRISPKDREKAKRIFMGIEKPIEEVPRFDLMEID